MYLYTLILAPIVGGEDYCYGISFRYSLLQSIVDTHCLLLDCEFDWVGSVHD